MEVWTLIPLSRREIAGVYSRRDPVYYSALAAKARRLKVKIPNVVLLNTCRRLVATWSARTYRTTLIRSTSIAIYFLNKCPCRVATLILVLIREFTAPHIGKSGELVCLHRRARVRCCLNAQLRWRPLELEFAYDLVASSCGVFYIHRRTNCWRVSVSRRAAGCCSFAKTVNTASLECMGCSLPTMKSAP